MDGPCNPFDLADTGALADGLAATRGGRGQVWLTVAPQGQPTVERKGRFGRRKEEPAGWCLAAQDWSKATEEADWTIWFAVPSGTSLGRRAVPMPPDGDLEIDGTDDGLFRFRTGTDPAVVATELCRLATALIAPAAPGGWFWRVGDSFYPYYRIDYWDV